MYQEVLRFLKYGGQRQEWLAGVGGKCQNSVKFLVLP